MKKLLATLLLLIAVTMSMNAAKSIGTPRDFTQPDGTTITVQLLGDEHFCWYQTVDGVLLDRVNDAFYIATITSSGTMESTGILAHNADKRSAEETEKAAAQDKDLFFSEGDKTLARVRRAIAGYPSSSFCPHNGSVKIPIILMEYTDTKFTMGDGDKSKLLETFEEYFNGTTKTPYSSATRFDGYSSVKQYFSDASYGKFTPEFTLYGPYTANNKHNYYGEASGKSFELLTEAVKKADGDIDFSRYDSNNDGYVDMVYIVYAGTGANLSRDNNDFWPACWYTASISTSEGKTIKVIGGANELAGYNVTTPLRAGIGVTCHEMSHGLGLPDLYWTSTTQPTDTQGYVDYNNCGPEEWDLMDGGENIYNAMWPCQYTAWERDIMGWETLQVINEPGNYTLTPFTKGGKSYRINNPNNKNEYYTLECTPSDEWNYYQANFELKKPNEKLNEMRNGMIMTHLNAGTSGFSRSPNNTYGKPNITIVPADGYILASESSGKKIYYTGTILSDSIQGEFTMPSDGNNNFFTYNYFRPEMGGDPYPGSLKVTEVAAYKNYKGADMVNEFPITNITRVDNNTITFDFMGGTSSITSVTNTDDATDNRIYTIDGRYLGTSKANLPSGIYIQNGKKFVK